MKVRCSCSTPECQQEIWFDGGQILWHTAKDGKESAFYLDANTIIALIRELKQALDALANQ